MLRAAATNFATDNNGDVIGLPAPDGRTLARDLRYPLRRWRTAYANAYYSPAVISVVGDSITAGTGADGNNAYSTGGESTYRARGFVAILRQRFASIFGDPGEGYIRAGEPRVVIAGGAAYNGSTGPYEQAVRLNGAGQTATYSLPACTQIDFYTWDGGTGTGCTITIDGASTGFSLDSQADGTNTFSAGSNNSSALTWTKHTITGLSNATHTMVVTGAASNTCYMSAVVALKAVTSAPDGTSRIAGVHVHRHGVAGNTTANLVGLDLTLNGNSAGQTRMMTAIAKCMSPNLIIIPLGVNDYSNQNSTSPTLAQPGTTPTTFAQNLQTFITLALAANTNCSILLVGEPRVYTAASPETYTESQYWAQMQALAAANDHVAYIDVKDVYGSTWAAGNALGLFTATSVHPSQIGHADWGHYIFGAITR